MIKFLKQKKKNKNEEDFETLQLLRKRITLNEQMKTFNQITEQEYIDNLIKIENELKNMEVKYDMDKIFKAQSGKR